MAFNAKKTEHTGPKKGCGGYAGRKADAKHESDKIRRRKSRKAIEHDIDEFVAESPVTNKR